jgi:hypothetical protein
MHARELRAQARDPPCGRDFAEILNDLVEFIGEIYRRFITKTVKTVSVRTSGVGEE